MKTIPLMEWYFSYVQRADKTDSEKKGYSFLCLYFQDIAIFSVYRPFLKVFYHLKNHTLR